LPSCPGTNGRAPRWDEYFPERIFDAGEDRHVEFTLAWYGGELAMRDEPVLSCPRPGQAEAYRFLFLRSFVPSWVVRVERTAAGADLQATESTCGVVPCDTQPTARRLKRLTGADWNRLTAAAAAADFWNLPAPEKAMGLDGETWVIEGLRPGAYHAVERWEPKDGSHYRTLGATLLDLAGLGDLAVIKPPTVVKPTAPEDLE
jgi:hypothetical protein